MFNRVINKIRSFKHLISERIFYAFLLLPFIISFSETYSQYYIDRSKIDELKDRKEKSYIIPKSEKENKDIYLRYFYSTGYFSDVKIGFDKDVYKNGDQVNLTLSRGYDNEEKRVKVVFSGHFAATTDQTKLEKDNDGPYYFYLNKGEKIKIKLNYNGTGDNCLIIYFDIFNIDKSPYAYEDREYYIIFPNSDKENLNGLKKRESRKRVRKLTGGKIK